MEDLALLSHARARLELRSGLDTRIGAVGSVGELSALTRILLRLVDCFLHRPLLRSPQDLHGVLFVQEPLFLLLLQLVGGHLLDLLLSLLVPLVCVLAVRCLSER